MKVLVVDDDVVARKVLGAFLKQSNYELQIVEDGLSAFRILSSPDAPAIAIVDWMMPDLTGPELCTRLRKQGALFRPYLILLSGRKEKSDIATALDAGADDFITKPFNIQEMQARLRVAERSIEHQLALHRKILELEEQLASRGPLPAVARAMAQPDEPAPQSTASSRSSGASTLEPHQIDTVVASALRHCSLNHTARRATSAAIGAQTVAWSSLLSLKDGSWVDLLLEMDRASLLALWSKDRDRPAPAATELGAFAVSLQLSLRESLRSVLRAMGGELLAPFPPQAIAAGEVMASAADASLQRHHYKVGGATLTFAFIVEPSPLQQKSTGCLQLFDILATAYPPATTHHVPLLRAGVVLKDHLIEKLRRFAQDYAEAPPVPVHRPSALALEYHRELPGRSR